MLICVCLVLLVILWRSRPVPKGQGYFDDYMDPAYTTAIKGVFILLIFLTHGEQYLTLTDSLPDKLYGIIRMGLGQSVVTAFFFYSGYGMMESLKRKGEPYLEAFPRMRILKTLVNFDLAVLLYVILAFVLGKDYSSWWIVQSLIGWKSVGNSAWFIFDITVAYVMFYGCFKPFSGEGDNLCRLETDRAGVVAWHKSAAKMFTGCSIAFVILMIFVQESRYYNTFLCVALGVWFSLYREPVERFVQGPKREDGTRTHGRFFVLLAGLAGLYLAGGILLIPVYEAHEYLYIPLPIIFMMALLLLTMVWRFDNPVLRYFGEHLFSVFILMRLPMIILSEVGLAENVYVFLLLSFIATVALAHFFDLFLKHLDAALFPPARKAGSH